MENTSSGKNIKSSLLMIEGVLIILLVLVAGFFAYQNQKLTEEIETLSKPAVTTSPIPTPSPSDSPTPTSTSTPTATPKVSLTPRPTGITN